jgi:hypothetical protein
MNLKSIKLDKTNYHDYLEGKEVLCSASSLTTKNLREGEHVLVYRDTVAANTDVSLPKREMQSEYIGIEGLVTSVRSATDNQEGVTIKKI